MRKILFLLTAMLFSAASAFAQGGTTGSLTWELNDDILTISGEGEIPDYDWSNMAPWYDYRHSIITVVMANGITSIGSYAFYYCYNLTSVMIPNGVISIKNNAFSECGSLTSVIIPNGVESIGYSAFSWCTGLTSIIIPSSVTSIGSYAFYYCYSLTSVTIPNGVESIGYGAFNYCIALTSIAIPGSVTEIGGYAFYNCTALTSVTISNGVKSIGYGAFNYCTALTSIIIPNSVTEIGDGTFSNCTALASINVDSENTNYASDDGVLFNKEKTVLICCPAGKTGSYVMPNSVTEIWYEAFYYCKNLTSITIPNSVINIGSRAFYYCTSLTSITIPSSVTEIGGYAFYNCSSLTAINVNNENTNYASDDGVLFNKDKTVLIWYPEGKTGGYVIPNSITRIEDYAFYNCTDLTSIGIPSSVIYIGYYAFSGCENLTSVTLPSSIIDIKGGAFAYCTGITSIHIPNGITSIEDETFYNCIALTSVTIPSSVTHIGNAAFANCNALNSITIPNGVTYIGYSAFYRCESLTAVNIPNGIQRIENYTFAYCSALTSVTIPSSVTTIGNSAFYYCTFTSITIPNSVINIEGAAFRNCGSLTSVTIPNGVTTIGYDAFYNCTALTSVIIPSSVTSIESGAFAYCDALTSVTNLNLTPVDISWWEFYYVDRPACTLKVPTSAVTAYQNAEIWKEFNIVGSGLLVNPMANNSNFGYTTGNGFYQVNATVTVTATPRGTREFLNWTKNGEVISINSTYSFTVTEDTELIANFKGQTYSVSVIANNDEYGVVTGGGSYEENTEVTVTATANDGYHFSHWSIKDDEWGWAVSYDAIYSFIVTEDVELVANFYPPMYYVFVGVNNEDYGYAGTDNWEWWYEENSTVTVRAYAYPGYRFVNWIKDGEVVSTGNPYSFTITENVVLIANFEEGSPYLPFDTYAVTKWNNTFMLNLNRLSRHGYRTIDCKWYKNGELIGEGFTYSVGPKITDQLEAGAVYTFELSTRDHGTLYSTDKVIEEQYSVLRAYPNPLPQGSKLTIEGTTQDSLVEVFNINGACVNRTTATGSVTELTLALPVGVYMVRANNEIIKVIIK